jgi:transcriptional regulator with XRE-family HTH domain
MALKRRIRRQEKWLVLREFRQVKGYPQGVVGGMINKSQEFISMVENGRLNPTVEELQQLADALEFEYPPAELLMEYDEWIKKNGKAVDNNAKW